MPIMASQIIGMSRLLNLGVVIVQHQENAGTHGGSCSANTWNLRLLNTIAVDPHGLASIKNNALHLPSGKYLFHFWAVAFDCHLHQCRLRHKTTPFEEFYGASAYSDPTYNGFSETTGWGYMEFAGYQDVELWHYTGQAKATTGLGVATNNSQIEVYAQVLAIKIG